MSDQNAEMIELEAPEAVAPEPAVSLKDAQEVGLDPREIEAGKKTGVIVEEKKDEKEDEKKDEKQGENEGETKDEKKPDAKVPQDKKPIVEKREFKERPWDKEVTEEEKQKLASYTPEQKALFYEKKKEKWRRQQAEAERDKERAQAAYWRGQAEALQKAKLAPADEKKDEAAEDKDDFLDEYGEKKEGEKDKPLTRADLDKIEKDKAEKAKKEQEAIEARRDAAIRVVNEQEDQFKEDHEDFVQVFDSYSMPIIDAAAKDPAKLAEMFPNAVERRGVVSMVKDWLLALREPEKHTGENSAPALAYEIGKLHPKFSDDGGSGAEEDLNTGEQGDEDSDDEDDKSLEQRLDKQGRPSSAPLNGGANRRPKSVHDLTVQDIADMSPEKIRALKKKYPGVVEKILRSA